MKKLSTLVEIDRDGWISLINQWVLDPKARKIVKEFLLEAKTLEELAEKYRFSVTHIKRILNKWQAVIYRHI